MKKWDYCILDDAVKKASSNISINKIKDDEEIYPLYGAKGLVQNISFFQQEEEYLAIIKDGAGIGRISRHPSKSSVVATMQYIIPKTQYNIQFVRYFLESIDFEKYRTGSTIPHIYYKDYKNELFPIVNINEQKQIVEILDKAFESIEQAKVNIEKNIENTKELFQSRLNEIFSQKGDGWEEKTLNEIAIEFGRGKSKHRPRNHESLFGGKYPFIQTGDVRNASKYVKNYTQTYSEIGLSQSKLWSKNTICITIAANIAETAILDFDSCFPDSIIGLQVDESKATVDFTYYALQYLKENLKLLGKGSAQDNINLGTFENEYFPFPKIEEQKKIALELDKLNEQTKQLEKHYKQKLKNLEELKKSILQKAFRGELLK
jgi:type I restriction enzyme S subunit